MNSKRRTSPGEQLVAVLAAFFTIVVLVAVFITIGWNYGASELLQKYGLGDHNINIVQGLLIGLFVRSILPLHNKQNDR